MEPVSTSISLAASIVTLIHVADRLREVTEKFRGLKEALKTLSRDVEVLLMLVASLKKIIENVEGALNSFTVTQDNKEEPVLPLFNRNVEEIAEELKQLLDSCWGGRSSRWWPKWFRSLPGSARYLINEGKVKELTTRMGQAQFNLVTTVSMASLKIQVDAHAAPAWASGIEDVMQHVSELPSAVEKNITAQFNTIAEQMLREQRLSSSFPARKEGPLGSSPRQEHIAFSNKSTTSFTASMRSLPDLPSKKSRGRGDVQEESITDQTNENESMIRGASVVGQRKHGLLDIFPNGTRLDKTQSESDTSESNHICTADTAISSEISLALLSEMSDSESIRKVSQDPVRVALQVVAQNTLITPTTDSEMNDGRLDKIAAECEEDAKQDMKVTGPDNTVDNPKPPNCNEKSQNDNWTFCDRSSCFNETISAAGLEFEESATSETGPANDNNDRKRDCYYSFPAGLETEESVVSGMGPINDHNDGKRQDYHPNCQENVWLVCRCGHIANSRLGFSSCPKCAAVDIISDSQLPGKIGHWIGASNLLNLFGTFWADDKMA
ncbi:hypothetical protein BS50DRAFT_574368 [Corynespora cassiicola Philippines]|uniref:Fungal N-terminal domain-containing protein n=1 Tax=Corynespora cassiicola Philippines TaxID=1448308 RepID=A0A2T2NLD3_CORCC|nr:hypothetical protein BS50DRAFT_574368 [Corynespora cassiicola Philippines]